MVLQPVSFINHNVEPCELFYASLDSGKGHTEELFINATDIIGGNDHGSIHLDCLWGGDGGYHSLLSDLGSNGLLLCFSLFLGAMIENGLDVWGPPIARNDSSIILVEFFNPIAEC